MFQQHQLSSVSGPMGLTRLSERLLRLAGQPVSNNIAGNDLILNGTVTAVPEPSTLTMIGLGMVGTLAFARRRFSRS